MKETHNLLSEMVDNPMPAARTLRCLRRCLENTPLFFKLLESNLWRHNTHDSPKSSIDLESADSILHAVFSPQAIPFGVETTSFLPRIRDRSKLNSYCWINGKCLGCEGSFGVQHFVDGLFLMGGRHRRFKGATAATEAKSFHKLHRSKFCTIQFISEYVKWRWNRFSHLQLGSAHLVYSFRHPPKKCARVELCRCTLWKGLSLRTPLMDET